MFKQSNDVFIVNELIGNNLTDLIVEGEVYLPEGAQDIDKIIYTAGNVKINNASCLTNKLAIYGELHYNMIYLCNNEMSSASATKGKIDFMEEIPMQNITEGMIVSITPSIDYIDAKILSEKKVEIKAVVNLNSEVTNKREVNYISGIESDGSFQAKSNNVSYIDTCNNITTELPLSDSIILDQNMNDIVEILKLDMKPMITECEIMNERMLIEGKCVVGVMYTENNSFRTPQYITKEIPFTHYVELHNTPDSPIHNVDVHINNYKYDTMTDDNDEVKIINCDMTLGFDISLYDKINKNLISDAYSTTNNIDITNDLLSINSVEGIATHMDDFEKSFDVDNVSIKDIYYYDATPKISEKNLYDDKMVIDGFIDVNVIFLNGDTGKIDSTSSSLPFTTYINLSQHPDMTDINNNIHLINPSVYRKGPNSMTFESKLKNKYKIMNNKNFNIISDIVEGEKLDNKNNPSIVFRVVQPNETLWDIAKDYNVSMNYLTKLNNLDIDSELIPGTKIIITNMV